MRRIIPPYVMGTHISLLKNAQPIETFDGDGDIILPDGRVLIFTRTLEGLSVQQTFQHPNGTRLKKPYSQCLFPWEKLPATNISRHADLQRRQPREKRTIHTLVESATHAHFQTQGVSVFLNYTIGGNIDLHVTQPQENPISVPMNPSLQIVFDTNLLEEIRKQHKDWKIGTEFEIVFQGLRNFVLRSIKKKKQITK